VQRSNRAVRTLSGRFLQVRVVLQGDGRTTPEIGALRVYASRFSYLNRYLPALYQETLFGDDADALIPTTQRSTPPDFLERFLDNFEGVLTPLEDRIANAYLLTSPQAAPEEAMEWLGSWIGLAFDPAYPVTSRRRLLQEAHILYWQRGTVPGLARGLNIATGDKVARGHIVILENFRLRRTFATILGADLADADDPLLAGVVNSGNSYVGDTLFLGDDNRQEFLALFGADLPTSTAEQDAIVAFLDALAFQATVLVHEDVGAQELGLIRRVVELETPAHVLVRVLQASHPFIVGVAALVGVDTYLRRKPGPEPVRVEQSHIGRRDFIRRPASLDPRLEGGLVEAALLHLIRPSADAGPDLTVGAGETIALDAGNSRAAQGRHVERYIWTWLQ
jgi:phage tail-like protein